MFLLKSFLFKRNWITGMLLSGYRNSRREIVYWGVEALQEPFCIALENYTDILVQCDRIVNKESEGETSGNNSVFDSFTSGTSDYNTITITTYIEN